MMDGVWLDLLTSNEMMMMTRSMKDTIKRFVAYSYEARNKVIACVYIVMH